MSSARRAGVLGRPISHSLSPALHRAAYAELGLDWAYDAVDCGVAELPGVLAERADWAGFSCTMPLKHAVLERAGSVRPLAAAIGSANTLVPGPAGWIADNTDVYGIIAAVREHELRPSSVTVLGAGGTAQAALAGLGDILAGGPDPAAACTVLVRDPSRTGALRAAADRLGVRVAIAALTPDAAALGADLVISTLPRGAADALAGRVWSSQQALLDVVYDPWPTAIAAAAAAAGVDVVGGAVMLLHQAAAQVELMTGRRAPVEAMRTALRAAAPGCGV